MPREQFPRKKKGDSLSARHVNDLSEACERVGHFGGGSYQTGRSGTGFFVSTGLRKQQVLRFEITRAVGDGVYEGQIRWFSHVAGEWKTDPAKWYLDSSDVSSSIGVGSKVSAYWDEQRGMFVPMAVGAVGAGETQFIQFEVLSAGPFEVGDEQECENAIRVTAKVLQVVCSGISGVQVDDRVIVWDPKHCHFDIPVEMLIGAVGTAVNVQIDFSSFNEYCAEYDDLLESGTCRWLVTNLACCEELYGCD